MTLISVGRIYMGYWNGVCKLIFVVLLWLLWGLLQKGAAAVRRTHNILEAVVWGPQPDARHNAHRIVQFHRIPLSILFCCNGLSKFFRGLVMFATVARMTRGHNIIRGIASTAREWNCMVSNQLNIMFATIGTRMVELNKDRLPFLRGQRSRQSAGASMSLALYLIDPLRMGLAIIGLILFESNRMLGVILALASETLLAITLMAFALFGAIFVTLLGAALTFNLSAADVPFFWLPCFPCITLCLCDLRSYSLKAIQFMASVTNASTLIPRWPLVALHASQAFKRSLIKQRTQAVVTRIAQLQSSITGDWITMTLFAFHTVTMIHQSEANVNA